MITKILQFLSLFLMALALIPAGAHFFELPGKIGLPQDQYFTVQGIYAGWALFGVVLFPAVIVDLGLAYVMREDRWPALLWETTHAINAVLTFVAFCALTLALVIRR
jgi:hypothetical protein